MSWFFGVQIIQQHLEWPVTRHHVSDFSGCLRLVSILGVGCGNRKVWCAEQLSWVQAFVIRRMTLTNVVVCWQAVCAPPPVGHICDQAHSLLQPAEQ